MISASVSGLEDIIVEFNQLADPKKVARMVNREITPIVERRLDRIVAEVPPPRDSTKFVWSFNRAANLRARRWWFAAIKRGEVNTDGRHYVRSGTIPNSWQTEIALSGDTILLTIFNPAPGSEYVYGSASSRPCLHRLAQLSRIPHDYRSSPARLSCRVGRACQNLIVILTIAYVYFQPYMVE
jgi:hypothetical protein